MDHQLEELTKAIEQTINIEYHKARIEIVNIIKNGMEKGTNPASILGEVLDWCGGRK